MKKWIRFAVALMLAAFCTVTVSAADGNVTYSENAGEFIFAPGSDYSPTDLFPEFKSVMPGDHIVQKITVKNNADKKVKVNIYLRSIGAHEESVDFLSQLHLQVEKSAENDMAYMFDAAADQTAGLTDWVYLGTLYSGGEVNLDVTLDVPVSLENQFQDQVGYLDWEFRVEELPVEPDDPMPPQTGDNSHITLWAVLLVISAAAIILLLLLKKKRNNETAATQ